MYRTLFTILALCFVSLNAMALTEIDRQELRWRNYHTNGGFESGITGVTWSVAPSAALGTLESVEKLNGNRSLKCLASQSNGYCETKLVLIPGQSGAATLNFFYKSAGTNWQAILEDEDNNEISVVNLASSSSFFTKQNIRYTSDQGVYYSLKVKDTSTSGFLPIYIDDVVQGPVVDINENQKLNWDSIEFSGSDIADIENKSHTSLTDIGTYTHDQIDTAISNSTSHIANTSNPHSVTKTQVGLGNVTDDAQIKKIASATDGNVVSFDGITGALVKDSGVAGSDVSSAVSLKHTQGTDTGSSSNTFTIGSGIPGDKFIAFNVGGSNPAFKWDSATSKLQFSNDGSSFSDMGSGGTSVSVLSPLDMAGSVISIDKATGSVDGYLSSVDWTTFNLKQDTLSAVSPLEIASNSISIRNGTTSGDVLTWNGSAWVSQASSGGSASTTTVSTTDFNGRLNSEDDTVQKALNVLEKVDVNNFYNRGSFERGALDVADIVAVHATVAADDTTYRTGKYSLSCTGTESEYSCSTPVIPLQEGVVDIIVSLYYKTSIDGAFSMYIYDQDDTLITQIDNLPEAIAFTNKSYAFTRTTETGVKIVVQDFVTSESFSPIYLDDIYVGKNVGVPSVQAPLVFSDGVISITTATTDSNGALTSTDWNTFNGKQDALTFSSPLSETDGTVSVGAASTSAAGVVQLSDSFTGTSQSTATTEKAVSDGLATKENRLYENLLTNSSFESGVTSWNEAGGGTIASETTTYRSGSKALKFTFSDAGDTLYPTAVNVLSGTNNCEASFYYNTSSAVIDVEVYFGSTKVAGYLNLPANGTGFRKFSQSFVCSDVSSAYTFKIKGGSDLDVIILDDAYIGPYKTFEISKAQFLGSIEWAPTSNCDIANSTSGTTPGDYTANTYCDDNNITYKGNAVADASNPGQLPQLRLLNVPTSGHLIIKAYGMFDAYRNSSTNAYGYYRFSDSTNTTTKVTVGTGEYSSANHNISIASIEGSLDLTSGGDKTYKLQCAGGTGCTIHASDPGLKIEAYWYPSASQTAVVDSSTSVFEWTGYHGGNNCEWVTTSSLATVTGNDADCVLTQLFNNNAGTVASVGTNKAGLVFTPNSVGDYEICANLQAGTRTGDAPATYKLVYGSTVLANANTLVSSTVTIPLCGIVNFSSLGSKQIDVHMASGNNTAVVEISAPSSGNQVAINWSIKKITQQIPMPQIVNSVTHSKANQQRIVHGDFNLSEASVCSIINSGTGDWSSSASSNICSITFSPAFSTNNYSCTCTTDNVEQNKCVQATDMTSKLAGGINYYVLNAAGSPSIGRASFICIGDK